MALWEWSELAGLGTLSGTPATAIEGISIDSRQATAGDLFIALAGDPGPRFRQTAPNARDGHEFIASAVNNGAVAVMLSDESSRGQSAYVKVEDTLDGLWQLGSLSRQRSAASRVAITGSAGKTTARAWLMHALETSNRVHGSTGSLNNHWGVPLSLARMPANSEIGVFEIGTNHEGEILPLSQLVKPHVAVLLNVLPAHIGNFPSFAALEKEKLSIAEGLVPDGRFLLPHILGSGASHEVTFGLSPDADANCQYSVEGDLWQVSANVLGEKVSYQLKAAGEHKVLTSLAVLTVAKLLDMELNLVANRLASVSSPAGRGNEIQVAGITIVDDSYNANPVSMQYALDALRVRPGRRIAILGEMMELGDDSAGYHSRIAEGFKAFDEVITVGAGFDKSKGHRHFASVTEINLEELADQLRPGDSIMVKGSNKVFWANQFVKRLVAQLESV